MSVRRLRLQDAKLEARPLIHLSVAIGRFVETLFYAILRVRAVVVPVNPMNLTEELAHYVEDSGATTAFVAQDLYARIAPHVQEGEGAGLHHLLVATYSDYLKREPSSPPPEFVSASFWSMSFPSRNL